MRRKTSLTKQIVQILVLFVVITVMLVSTSQGLLVKRIYKSKNDGIRGYVYQLKSFLFSG